MQFTTHSNGNKERAIASLLDRSPSWFLFSFIFALPSGVIVQPNLSVTLFAVGLALICALCALYLLRHYNFWYSWLWWLPLLPAFYIVFEPMRTGEVSVAAVAHAFTLGGSLMFGTFWYFRKALRKWAS